MRFARRLFVFCVLVALPPLGARAEEPGRVGLTMGYPASFGVLLRASNAVAVRPYFTFLNSSSGNSVGTSDSTSAGVGLSAIFYIARHDNLRTFVSPDVAFQHVSISGSTPVTATQSTYSAGGFFGGEYTLSSRVGLFADVGLRYSHSSMHEGGGLATPANVPLTIPDVTLDETFTLHGWQTATAIGAILYF